MVVNRSDYPWWVKLSLLGVPGRGGVVAYAWLSVLLALISVWFAFRTGQYRYLLGATLLAAAFPYAMSVRWVDRHGSWDRDRPREG